MEAPPSSSFPLPYLLASLSMAAASRLEHMPNSDIRFDNRTGIPPCISMPVSSGGTLAPIPSTIGYPLTYTTFVFRVVVIAAPFFASLRYRRVVVVVVPRGASSSCIDDVSPRIRSASSRRHNPSSAMRSDRRTVAPRWWREEEEGASFVVVVDVLGLSMDATAAIAADVVVAASCRRRVVLANDRR